MKSRHSAFAGLTLLAAVTTSPAAQSPSADWPQWRGPNRDGSIASFVEPKSWPETLARKWKVDVGLGYASPVLVGGRVYLFSRQGDNEVLQALNADTGAKLWDTKYPASFTMNPAAARHEKGPKATPTFAGGKLFTLGMTGIVTATDAATGKRLWQTPASQPGPLYHTSMSPLVDRGLAIVHVGSHNQGALTAYDVNTGAVKWHWDGDGPGYASPIVAELEGTRQVITFTQDNLVGVSASTGELLWKRPFKTRSTRRQARRCGRVRRGRAPTPRSSAPATCSSCSKTMQSSSSHERIRRVTSRCRPTRSPTAPRGRSRPSPAAGCW